MIDEEGVVEEEVVTSEEISEQKTDVGVTEESTDTEKVEEDGNKPSTEESEDVGQTERDGEPPKEAAATEFKPDYSYKSYGKDYEMPEWAQKTMTEENAEQLREVFRKAESFETTKLQHKEAYEKFTEERKDHTELQKDLGYMDDLLKRNDFRGFFKAAGKPLKDVYQWVEQEVKLVEGTPEEREAYERTYAIEQNEYNTKQQNQKLQEQNQSMIIQQTTNALQQHIDSTPDVKAVADNYNQRMFQAGKQDNFIDHVFEYATRAEEKGISLSIEQAVQDVMIRAGNSPQPVHPQAVEAQTPSVPSTVQRPVPTKPLPTIQGKSTSPTRPAMDSIDAIRKKAAAMQASG